MKSNSLLVVLFLLVSNIVLATSAGGSTELVDGRIKIQFRLNKDESRGSYQLRSILEKNGFESNEGFVRTGNALAPLEIYSHLHEDGRYAFTIFLPVDDEKFFVSFHETGFISFEGVAAQKLFDVVKLHLPRTDVNNLEKYRWADMAFCDRTKSGEVRYRCFFHR